MSDPDQNDGGKCEGCGREPGTELHECPYKSEICGDETPCNCCDGCAYDCAMDI